MKPMYQCDPKNLTSQSQAHDAKVSKNCVVFISLITFLSLLVQFTMADYLYNTLLNSAQIFEHDDDPKFLLYFTTYNSARQFRYFDCWKKIFENDSFLRDMDVIFYFGDTVESEKFNDKFQSFPNKKKTFIKSRNPGYQKGAILAFRYGFQHELFKSYDWVIRMNLDVLIYNSSTLQKMMQNRTSCGIFANCNRKMCENRCIHSRIQSDFTVFRPKCLNNTEVLRLNHLNAEQQVTDIFKKVVFDGKDQWIVTRGNLICRINWYGKGSGDIEHRHKPCKIV